MTTFRTIGTDPLFPIGLGLMGMSEFYGQADREQSIAVIHHALDHGVRLLDTADAFFDAPPSFDPSDVAPRERSKDPIDAG